jgi:hypothetical protein
MDNLQTWNDVETYIHTLWKNVKTYNVQTELFSALRSDAPISNPFATPLVDCGVLPTSIIDIALGVLCEEDTTLDVSIGGHTYCTIDVKAGVPTPICTKKNGCAYPIISTSYHVVKFISKSSTQIPPISIIGIRFNKEIEKKIIQNIGGFIVPDMCVFKSGLCYTMEDAKEENINITNAVTFSPLPSVASSS